MTKDALGKIRIRSPGEAMYGKIRGFEMTFIKTRIKETLK
jgi:hypothetical protein